MERKARVKESKHAQEELQQLSEHKYRELYDTMPVGCLTIDKFYSIREANTVAAKMFGMSKRSLLKSKFTLFIVPDRESRDTFFSHIREAIHSGSRRQCAVEMQRSNKSRFYAGLSSVPVANMKNTVTYIHIVVTDVTNHHQIELDTNFSEEKYRHLFETMSQGVIYQDSLGGIISANAASQRILGLTIQQMKEQGSASSHGRAIHEDGSEFSDDQHPSSIAIKTGQAVKDVIMGFFNQKEGAYRWTSVCAMPQFKPGVATPYQTYIILSDITERKRAEEALVKARDELEIKVKERTLELEESEEKYRKVVEYANEAIFVSQEQKSKLFNSKALELFGYADRELAAKPLSDLIFAEDRDLVMKEYKKRMTGEETSASYEHRIICKDGGIKWVTVNAVSITWENKPASLVLLTDITTHKNMEQELKAYARRITQVQEEERKRIAYELHDDTVQYLSILKLQLDSLIHSGKIRDTEILGKLSYLEKDAGRAVDDVRRYSHELRPGVLEHLGLQAALEQIAEDINKLDKIAVDVNVEGEEPEISEEIKLGLFRIAQEALNNARKHAKASRADISLRFTHSYLKLIVSDNGTGFDLQWAAVRSNIKGSLGLISMRERAKLIGADLNIESRLGKGTNVIAEVKL